MADTTIPIDSDTRDRLRGAKVGNDTYSEVIDRLLDEADDD
jgi:predicted CopG family antitoxin